MNRGIRRGPALGGTVAYTSVTLYHPPLHAGPPPMDLGRFEISKGPCFRGGWTLDFLRFPRDPVGGGGWTLDFSESPTDPPGGGCWTLGLSESPTDPLGGGCWTLDLKKERIHLQGGGKTK